MRTNEVILFQLVNSPVSIMTPCDCGLSTLEVGQKDVPEGVPFWIVDAGTIQADREYRDAWTIDPEEMGDPSGTGGTYAKAEVEA